MKFYGAITTAYTNEVTVWNDLPAYVHYGSSWEWSNRFHKKELHDVTQCY